MAMLKCRASEPQHSEHELCFDVQLGIGAGE